MTKGRPRGYHCLFTEPLPTRTAAPPVYYVLLTILVLDAMLLTAVVLLQAGKGGGLAAMGAAGAGSDSLFGSRQAATLLTKASWWTGGIFLALCFSLSIMSSRVTRAEPILRGAVPATAPTTSPALPGATQPQPAAPGATTPAPAPTPAPEGGQ